MLSTTVLLTAYRAGIFPMAVNRRGDIGWFSPDPRALIPLDERFHVPHGLRRALKKSPFQVRFDSDFEAVIQACAISHGETWISKEIIQSYSRLHSEGHAHSVEAWLGGALAGGLYGVHVGGAFFGESMFHHATDASKMVLVALVERLRKSGFLLLDTQWTTPHLEQFGTYQIPKCAYLKLLKKAVDMKCVF